MASAMTTDKEAVEGNGENGTSTSVIDMKERNDGRLAVASRRLSALFASGAIFETRLEEVGKSGQGRAAVGGESGGRGGVGGGEEEEAAMHRQGGRGGGYRAAAPGPGYYEDVGGAQEGWRGGDYMPGLLRTPGNHLQHPQQYYHQQQQHGQGGSQNGSYGGRGGRSGRQGGVQGGGIWKRPPTTQGFNGRGRKGWRGRGKKNLTKEALDADLDQWRLKDKKFGATSLDADLDDYWKNRKDDDPAQAADDKEAEGEVEALPEETGAGERKANGIGIARAGLRDREVGEKADKAVANGD